MRSRGFRMMTGMITVAVFAMVGGVLVSESRVEVGGPILALAALRAGVLVRDVLLARSAAREDDEDED
ncbi:MAG: putative effector of murein hydrolase LrgA (UPF0299 family) [Myxococcota bacterium]|jgi:putative effector of murein hydrolase LrgA (UPF0299 family)